MTLQEEKIQDERIRGTPEIGRRGTVPQVRPSAMPRFDHEHRKPVDLRSGLEGSTHLASGSASSERLDSVAS